MSDIHYENRQLALWAEYKDLKGTLTFDAFLERHVKVNAYVVNLMREHGALPDSVDRAAWDDPMHPTADDYADAYANPKGGI